jgi:hypothetical protein
MIVLYPQFFLVSIQVIQSFFFNYSLNIDQPLLEKTSISIFDIERIEPRIYQISMIHLYNNSISFTNAVKIQ